MVACAYYHNAFIAWAVDIFYAVFSCSAVYLYAVLTQILSPLLAFVPRCFALLRFAKQSGGDFRKKAGGTKFGIMSCNLDKTKL